MSDEMVGRPSVDEPKTPLGIGSLLGESVSIFFRRWWLFIPIALIITVGLTFINYQIFGASLFLQPQEAFADAFSIVASLSGTLVNILASALMMAVLALAAYDTKLRRPVRVGTYFTAALPTIIPVIILSLVSSIAMGIGFVLLVVPGLFLMTIWSVTTPAVVLDKAGFSGLSRSAELTKGHRWPVFGFILLMLVIMLVVASVIGGAAGYGMVMFESPSALNILLLQGAVSALTNAFFAVAVVVLFARLKELKEGVGMDDLSRVFE